MTTAFAHHAPHTDLLTASAPSVSIIIPAYNEERTIGRALAAALDQTVPALEIIVVDNRSTDATAAVVARIAAAHPDRGIRLIDQHAVQGIIPTRNAGFAAARGDILGRIDADSIIDRGWVESVGSALMTSDAGAVTGPVSYYDLPLSRASQRGDDLVRRALRGVGRKYPFLYGSNMAIRATAWSAIQHDACLDPDDLLHEDIDLAVHLYEAGIVAAYDSSMIAGVSARRMDTSPASFRDYTRRFDRTYSEHNISHWYLGLPQLLLRGLYWPVHYGRAMFAQSESQSVTPALRTEIA